MSQKKHNAEGQKQEKENFETGGVKTEAGTAGPATEESGGKTAEGQTAATEAADGQAAEKKAAAEPGGAGEADRRSAEEGAAEKAADSGTEKPDGQQDASGKKRSDEQTASEKQQTPEQKKIDDLTDQLKRQMAEFENFRKRSEKEKGDMFDAGAKSVLEKILPVVDNFERGLANAPEGDPFADGVLKIYKQLQKALDDIGLKPIEAEGKPFDPAFHNAVMHVEDDSFGENEVAEELQKGYTYHDQVVRHSMVKVAN